MAKISEASAAVASGLVESCNEIYEQGQEDVQAACDEMQENIEQPHKKWFDKVTDYVGEIRELKDTLDGDTGEEGGGDVGDS